MQIQAKDLRPGDVFAFSTRKNAKMRKIILRDDAIETIGEPPEKWKLGPAGEKQRGKLLILLTNCAQIVLDKEDVVFTTDVG
jgi:hypothetical protein